VGALGVSVCTCDVSRKKHSMQKQITAQLRVNRWQCEMHVPCPVFSFSCNAYIVANAAVPINNFR
jgi:hypothetical protein